MGTPRHPDQDESSTVPSSTSRTKAIIAGVVLLLVIVISLHLAGVFGP